MLHIITLNWQGKEKLERLYPSLLNNIKNLNVPVRWHIKDNASTDGSIELIESWKDDNVVLHKYPHNNDNYSKGMNFLIKESGAKDNDYVMTLNNDITFNDSTSIAKMIQLQQKTGAGAVGAKLNYTNTTKIQHAGVLFSDMRLPFHYRLNEQESKQDRRNRYFPVVTGAITLFPGSVIMNVYDKNTSGIKGFNENYHWAFDDVDCCMRITFNLKNPVVYCGETSISHDESASLKKNPINKLFFQKNADLFKRDWTKVINTGLVKEYQKNPNFNVVE